MAYDRYTTVHHLTTDGWSHGEDRPADAVETWECDVNQASGWSDEDRDWTCTWASPAVPREERDSIRKKHREKIGMVAGRVSGCRVHVGEPI